MARIFYSLLLYLLVPVVLVRLGLRGLRNPDYWRRWPERFGFIARLPQAGAIWLHAVSVGETRAAVPLVHALMQRYPQRPILITTMTPTGSAQVRALFGDQVAHCYVPYDLPLAVRRFLERGRPSLAIIMETELWPNLFYHCRARAIPLLVANVRMSEKSMGRYLKFAALTRATLQQVNMFAVQFETDALRLRRLGAAPERVRVTGSIKFDISMPAQQAAQARALRSALGKDRPVWLAASTRDGEEETVLAVYRDLKIRFPSLLLVLVPRHPERFATVARLCRDAGFAIALRSAQLHPPGESTDGRGRALSGTGADGTEVLTPGLPRQTQEQFSMRLPRMAEVLKTQEQFSVNPATDILVGDTMGELALFFGAADVAFVGGSLVPTGGHNILEACAAGIPVVFGPHMFNFTEISHLTVERGAGRQVTDAVELGVAVGAYLADAPLRATAGAAGRRMIEENRGALAANLALIQTLLPQ